MDLESVIHLAVASVSCSSNQRLTGGLWSACGHIYGDFGVMVGPRVGLAGCSGARTRIKCLKKTKH